MDTKVRCYIINLDRDTERWHFIEAQVKALGLSYSRIPGVLGSSLSDAECEHHYDASSVRLTTAEIGCLKSHMLAWKCIAEAEEPLGLVMEDDIHMSPRLPTLLEQFEADTDQLEIVRFEAFPETIDVLRRREFSISSYSGHELNKGHSGSAAYLVNKITAKTLLQRCKDATVPVDHAMFNRSMGYNGGVRIIQLIPAPCIQDDCVIGHLKKHFLSTISDRLTYEKRQESILKNFLRPAYRSLVSILLIGYGIKRTHARFY